MCGIAGFVTPPGEHADRAVLERMVKSLRHRGPDTLGYHVSGRAALGVARLRVIDLETGDQPISTEDGSATVVLNGEIYDFEAHRAALAARGHQLRSRSDTEVIAHLWEDVGVRVPDRLNGMFAFALWDRIRECLFLARDRMGEKPLYYTTAADGSLVFASELRALIAHPRVSARLDLEGVARYLAYEYVPDPHSILSGVAKLAPAHSLLAVDGRVETRRYWDIPFSPEPAVDERTWHEEIARRFDCAVASRMRSDVPVGCFVSGGIDSTLVVGTAARLRAGIRTFSVGYDGVPQDERRFARIVAEHFATQHEEVVVSASDAGRVVERLGSLLDEPLADMSFVPLHILSCAARRSVTVALTGDGGDELFAGYPSMAADRWHRSFARLPVKLLTLLRRGAMALPEAAMPFQDFLAAVGYGPDARNQALIGGLPPPRIAMLLSPEARSRLRGFDPYGDIDAVLASCPEKDATSRLIYRYCKHYLAGLNLVNADRASMSTGLELRAPFLDHTFVEFLGRIPSHFKLSGFRDLKGLLKRALADRLPPAILRRGKQGFGVPFGHWFRGPLAGVLREVLSPDRMRRTGLFDPDAVWRLVNEHVAGTRDHDSTLWSLFAFELWRLEYLRDGAVL